MTSETLIDTNARGATPLPGDRLRRWTLRQMLRDPARDLLAVRGRQASALVLGCGSGELARYLLGLGFGRVRGIDARPELVAAARSACAERAIEPERLDHCAPGEPAADGPFDLVLIEDVAGAGGDESAALALARERARGACAIVSGSRLLSRDRAREAGFARVALVQPPADAERSFVLLERALLLAHPPDGERDG